MINFNEKPADYEYIAHNFKKRGFLPWSMCQGCGLLTLNNQFTEWSIKKGCDAYYHPSYKNSRLKYTEVVF